MSHHGLRCRTQGGLGRWWCSRIHGTITDSLHGSEGHGQPRGSWQGRVPSFCSLCGCSLDHSFFFSSQMGTGQSFNSQFLQHGGPRGPSVPPGMNPASMGGMIGPSGLSPMAVNPTRAAGLTPLYGGQRLPQHGYPGPAQAQPLPRQGVKRTYSEVSVWLPSPFLPSPQSCAKSSFCHEKTCLCPAGPRTLPTGTSP